MEVGNEILITGGGTSENAEIASFARRLGEVFDEDDSEAWARRLASGQINLKYTLSRSFPTGSSVQVVSVSVVGSDPITRYGSNSVKFWLPNFILVSLLKTKHINLLGSTFPGPSKDLQWFERFVITSPESLPIVQVSIKKNIVHNRTAPPRLFSQLDITIENSASPLKEMTPVHVGKAGREMWQDFATHGGSVRFRVGRQQHNPPRVESNTYEYVYIQTPDLVFGIAPSHAAVEFRNEWFQNERKSAYQYTHLDMMIIHQEGERNFGGILPELWGVRPMSDEVRAMTIAPGDEAESNETEGNETLVCDAGCLLPRGPVIEI